MADNLSVRQYHKITLIVNGNESGSRAFTQDTSITAENRATVSVASSDTNKQVNLNGMTTADIIYVTTDQQVTMSVDNTSKHWTINKFLAFDGAATALYFTGNGSTNATVTVWVFS